ncbi:MAG: MFS transporter [candidate division SR1 bacterium]|nr:MFS transporter [candidate division SR1 bacterium]
MSAFRAKIYGLFKEYWAFWIFLTVFKFAAGLHYTLLSPLGEKVFPLRIVGIAIGLTSVLQLIFDIPAGYLLDKYGYLKMLKVTTAIFIIAAICLFFKFTGVVFVLTLLASSFGRLFFGPGVNAYVLSKAPKEDAGKFISLRDSFESFGIVISSAVLAFILPLPTPLIGVILFVILSTAWILLFFAKPDIVSVHLEKKIEEHHYYIKKKSFSALQTIRYLNPASTILIISTFSAAIFYSIIRFVVPLMIANSQGGPLLGIGLGVFDFSVVILGFLIGRIADKYNKKKLVFIGLLIFSLSGIVLGLNFGLLFIILGFIATTGDEIAGISLWARLSTIEKNHSDDGKLSGMLSLSGDIGRGVGPMLAGFLYISVGASSSIMIGGCFLLTTLIIYSIMTGKTSLPTVTNNTHLGRKPHTFRHKR